jgi:myb proto-oncogene protein
LTEAVEKYGKHCWIKVAMLVPGRTNQQCRVRWTITLDRADGMKKGKWSPEEDAKLTEAVQKHGKKWVTVAWLVTGRTEKQCQTRWVNTVDPANEKNGGQWSPEEDAKLTEAVQKHGKNWITVAWLVTGRTDKQCRTRWVRNLDPDLALNTV